jgi:hypothetical protein
MGWFVRSPNLSSLEELESRRDIFRHNLLFCTKKLTRETQMVANTSLEERLAAVEAAIAELQKQVVTPQTTNWLQQITGSFKDEPAFEEVLAYGRAIREGDESLLEIQDES